MNSFQSALEHRLASIRQQNLLRELRPVQSPQGTRLRMGARSLLNFSSNDYLGLANEPALKEAACRAIADFGVGAGSSRLICGSLSPHHELESAIAAFKDTEAALTFSSGYATALGTIGALLGKDDIVILDKLAHACLVDAARLCGAKIRVFKHNDLNRLESILQWADQRRRNAPSGETAPRVLIVTESVFSMDGDFAPLRELVELKERYGAWLLLDEAHATGLLGTRHSGLAEALAVADRVEVQMGTLGKALGAAGGYIAGSKALIDLLVNRARSFVFSTAPSPAAVAAARAGLELVQSPEGERRCRQLFERVEQMNQLLGEPDRGRADERNEDHPQSSFLLNVTPPFRSAIIPLIVGAETTALSLAAALQAQGIFIPAIRYPTVARNRARLRLTVTATHTPADIQALRHALAGVRASLSNTPHA